MIEAWLRTPYQQFFALPIAERVKYRISPNQFTAFAGATGLLAAMLITCNFTVAATILLLISGICDTLDGTLARELDLSTPYGTLLDFMTDRFVEGFIILGLYLVDPLNRDIACFFMLISIMLTSTPFFIIKLNERRIRSQQYISAALVERTEIFLFFGLMILLPTYFKFLAYTLIFLLLLSTLQKTLHFKAVNG